MSVLVTGSYDHTIQFWDELRGEAVRTLELPSQTQVRVDGELIILIKDTS